MAANAFPGEIRDGPISNYFCIYVLYVCAKFHTFIIKRTIHSDIGWTRSVFVYIKLGMEVGEGGKRVQKKVKRKPTCRDNEIICLIEGIGNEKSILMSKLQHSVTIKKKGSLASGELTAQVNSPRMALRTEDDLSKNGKILNLRSLNALHDQGKVVGRPPSTPPLYADIIMDTIGEGTYVTTGIDGEHSYLVKRMITVCGVCCTFKCHRIMYNS